MKGSRLPTWFTVGFLILALIGSSSTWASPQAFCTQFYRLSLRQPELAFELFRKKTMQDRKSIDPLLSSHSIHLLPKDRLYKNPIIVNGMSYKIEGLLGISGSKVYLATSPVGRKVVIKMDLSESAFSFEIRLTEFLMLNGFEVPRIIDTQWTTEHRGILVKEYFDGLTHSEVETILKDNRQEEFGLEKQDIDRLDNEFEALYFRYQELVENGFSSWLLKNYPREHADLMNSRPSLVTQGDRAMENYQYSIRLKRWRKYDP